MKNIIIRNANGEQISTNVVRYFRLNGVEFFIFSLNETDEGGYVKLYVSKIVDGIGKTIEDDVEWNLIKDTIKTIIKSNKDKLPLPITDLSISRINNLQIIDQKIFKLNDSLLQLLMANQSEETNNVPSYSENVQQNIINPIPIATLNPEVSIVSNPTNVEPVSINPINYSENSVQDFNLNYMAKSIESDNSLGNFNNSTVEDTLDYKTLYDNELKKTQELTIEIEKYKNIVNSLKNILNQNID